MNQRFPPQSLLAEPIANPCAAHREKNSSSCEAGEGCPFATTLKKNQAFFSQVALEGSLFGTPCSPAHMEQMRANC